MTGHADAAGNRSVKALVRRDDDRARRAGEEDGFSDDLDLEIDELALDLLALCPPPFAPRLITAAMTILHNLERVGGEATTTSRRCLELSREPRLQETAAIGSMVALAVALLKDALDAFVHRDPAKARAVTPRDRQVDDMDGRLQTLLAAAMAARPAATSYCLDLMVVCRSLEPIADHATNVAEVVVYLYEGCDIRHAALRPAHRTFPALRSKKPRLYES
ncbi:MAG TPA: PhoU domain-containing protein [Methylomirabilota bacterium]|nr:PhoU domain-containing protein [Methylomirabilota bacterium]